MAPAVLPKWNCFLFCHQFNPLFLPFVTSSRIDEQGPTFKILVEIESKVLGRDLFNVMPFKISFDLSMERVLIVLWQVSIARRTVAAGNTLKICNRI